MTILTNPIALTAEEWESIKSTFATIAGVTDEDTTYEIAENAIIEMEKIQSKYERSNTPYKSNGKAL